MGFIRWGGKKFYPQKPKPYKPDINELMKPLSEKVGKGNIWGSVIMNVEKGGATPLPPVSPTPTPSSVTPTPTASITPTPSITPSITPSVSVTPSITPSVSLSPTPSITPSITPSVTATLTPTPTPSSVPFDSDAAAFLDRVLVSGGTGITATVSAATNTLITDLKSNSLYSKILALYPVLGGVEDSNRLDVKNNFDGNFTGNWTYDGLYNIPDGTTTFFDTTFIPSVETGVTLNDMSVGFYLNDDKRPTTVEAYETDMGVISSGGAPRLYLAPYRRQNDETAAYINSSITPAVNGIVTDTKGLWILSRTGSTQNTLFRNGSSLNTYVRASTSEVSAAIKMSAKFDAPVTHSQFSTRKWSFLFIAQGLSDDEVSTLSSIINTFQTSLSRNTYT